MPFLAFRMAYPPHPSRDCDDMYLGLPGYAETDDQCAQKQDRRVVGIVPVMQGFAQY
jgi:hypothetical protein